MKKFKSALSLLTAIIMVFAIMPTVLAEGEAEVEVVNPGISKLPTGNSDGRLIFADTVVRVGNDVAMDSANSETYTDGSVLIDGFHFSTMEVAGYLGTADISVDSDSVILTTPDGKNTLTGTRTLDEINNTIEFEWSSDQSVKRLEMWVWPISSINEYEIQYFDGASWVKHSEGTLDQSIATPAVDAANYAGKNAVSNIILFDSVETSKLRFVVNSFKTGVTSAKIAEAVPRSNDNVNLLGQHTLSKSGSDAGWLSNKSGHYFNSVAPGKSRYSSPYASKYTVSGGSGGGYTSSGSGHYHIFPTYDSYNSQNFVQPKSSGGEGAFWYAVNLTNSPKKVSEVTFRISGNEKFVREFKIWGHTDNVLPTAGGTVSDATLRDSGWKLLATVNGNFKGGSVISTVLPEQEDACSYLIDIADYDSGLNMSQPALYVYDDTKGLFGNGASFGEACDESILNDGWYYTVYESATQLKTNTSIENPDNPENNLDKLAKFTSENSGIEYSFTKPTKVKRLDLWLLNVGGIDEYCVETSDNGIDWVPVKEDSFERPTGVAYGGTAPLASYRPIIFDSEISAKNIRFRIKSFLDDSNKVAYISEAKLLSSNNINLAEKELFGLNETRQNKMRSPYLFNFFISQNNNNTDNVAYNSGGQDGKTWTCYNTGDKMYVIKDESGFWYSTTFGSSIVKVNKVGLTLNKGSITEFEIWGTDNSSLGGGWSKNPTFPIGSSTATKDQWTKIATVSCNITPDIDADNGVLFELPKADEYGAYLFNITESSEGTQLSDVQMYALADYELTPVLSDASAVAADGLVAGKDVTFSVFSCNNTKDADVFFALYSGTQLIGVDKKDMPLSGVKTHTATYTIPANTTETDLSVKAYMWDGTTLVPLLPSAVTATAPAVEETPAE